MKNEIKRFIDCYVPTEICNFKCSYCYIGQRDGFTGENYTIDKTPREVRKALSKKRFGGTMFLNFCAGGETLLSKEILEIVYELLKEGHIVQIVTNGTITKKFEEIVNWDASLLDRLFIKFSFHYMELKRLHLLETFFQNISMVKEHGVSISLEITPCDEMIPYIPKMKQISLEKLGALPHVTVARNNQTKDLKILSELSKEEYVNTWGIFGSPMFDLKMRLLSEKRCEYCYAGEWTLYLNIMTGELKQCYKGDIIDNIYKDVNAAIHFKPIGTKCRESYCFNGHAWLTWGAIPNMNLPTYADMRNRIQEDGGEWLSKTVKEAFSCKLEDRNTVYSNTDTVPKVVMFGDSTLARYIDYVKQNIENKAYIYYNGENSKFSTNLYRYLPEWADKMQIGSNIDIVYFNVGLWDVLRLNADEPCVDIQVYKKNLKKIVAQMRYLFPNAQLIFSTTTPVHDTEWFYSSYRWERNNEDIEAYNQAAREVMNEENIQINDLWKVAKIELKDEYVDATHFTENGYRIMGEVVSKTLLRIIDTISCKSELSVCIKDKEYGGKINLLKKRRVIVYGAGKYGKKVVSVLKEQGIHPYVVLDRNVALYKEKCCGVDIMSPNEYILNEIKEGDVVIIALQNPGLWNNIIPIFSDCKKLDVCTYRILGIK